MTFIIAYLTLNWGIVHKNDLFEEMSRGGGPDAVYRPPEDAPRLIVKYDNYRCTR